MDGRIHLYVRDNGPNLVAAMRLNQQNSIGCFAHTLNLVIDHAIKDQIGAKVSHIYPIFVDNLLPTYFNKEIRSKSLILVDKFRNAPNAREILTSVQTALNMPCNVLVSSSPTRWSSEFHMFETILKNKKAIIEACEILEYSVAENFSFTESEWLHMEMV